MQLSFKNEYEHANYHHRKSNDRNRITLMTSFKSKTNRFLCSDEMMKKSSIVFVLVLFNMMFLAESSTHYTNKMSEMSSRFKQSTHKIPMNFQHYTQPHQHHQQQPKPQPEPIAQESTHNSFHHSSKFHNENMPMNMNYNLEEENLNKQYVTSGFKNTQQQHYQQLPQQNHVLKNEKNTLEFSDNEVINKKALIDAFKMKLLKLLDVEAAPSPLEVNITKNPIPEPVIREYNKLVKMSKAESNRKYFNSLNRGSRDMSLRSHENELEDESVRFNGSVVQQITLLPAKDINGEYESCDTNNLDDVFGLYTTVDCFMFALEQSEFNKYDIDLAKLYMKLNANDLNVLLSILDLSENESDSEVNLYVEVNDKLVKKINLIQYLKSLNRDLDNFFDVFAKQSKPHFEQVDIKEIIESELSKANDENQQSFIKVRIFYKSKIDNFTHADLKLSDALENFNDNVALNVKFGEPLPTPKRMKRSLRKRGLKKSKNYQECSDLRRLSGSSSKSLSCCRETISFSMEQIGWSHWILSPKVIEYKYCRGGCSSGNSPRFDNTQIVYKMFELSHSLETSHCCNIYDYEEDIPFVYGTPPNYLTKMVSLNAKNCLCS